MLVKKEDRDKKGRFTKEILPWNKGKIIPERSGKNHHFYGKTRSNEVRKKISLSLKQKYRNNLSPWNKGQTNIYSKEQLKTIVEGTKKAMKKPGIKDKVQKTQYKKGNIPWMTGKNHSNETILKLKKKTRDNLKNSKLRKKIEKTFFKKGIVPWNKGKKAIFSDKNLNNMEINKKGFYRLNPKVRDNISKKMKEFYILHSDMKKKLTENTKKMWKEKKGFKEMMRKKANERWKDKKFLNKFHIAHKKAMQDPEVIEKIRKARLKQIFPKKDTKIEILMQDELRKRRILFNTHKPLFNVCQADLIIPKNKLVIFCDGDYWHANPVWMKKRKKTKLNKAQKFNRKRDELQNKILKEKGWKVLRFWECDIHKDIKNCVDKIERVLKN
ncbi:hypothetical protein CL617_03030 [archaeon]|nr:hypothetical protein [archaeon]|tara:strand:+ start:15230 stop:16381 length:1152 start_codon:yes stop_codon:yes gene_type:complete